MSRLFVLPALLLAAGCGGQAGSPKVVIHDPANEQAGAKAVVPLGTQPQADGQEAPLQRKVVQTGYLDVIVPDFEVAHEELKELFAVHKAVVVKSEFTGSAGARRGATWTVRVPVDDFQAFVDGVVHLGKPVRHSTEAQDVTEEYIDLEARVKNFKAEEEGLNGLLKKAQSTADVLAFRQQISDIRGNVERAEGRLNALSRLTTFSTVYLSMHEEKDYAPPASPNAPTFGAAVQGTWDESLGVLGRFGKAVALFAVALAPWLPLLVPPAAVVAWHVRRARRKPTVG
jgi:Domain of unknown function (DUF4349)